MGRVWKALIALVICIFAATNQAGAGGAGGFGSGLGLVSPSGMIEGEPEVISSRLKIALEYALENEEFLRQMEGLALQHSLMYSGAPPLVAAISADITQKTLELSENGVTTQLAIGAIANIAETVITTAFPQYATPVTVSKITLAFSVAFAYGFFFGQ